MQMNQSQNRFKLGQVDKEINFVVKVTVILMLCLSLLMVLAKGINRYSPIMFLRYLLLFSYMIPIATKLNVDIAKAYYCFQMSHDFSILGCVARN